MLRIDLLPPGVRRARTNRKLLALIVLLLLAAGLGVGFYATTLQAKLSGLQEEYTKVKAAADEVRATEAEAGGIQGRLQPIADKISFIRQADECGYPYWERFFEIAEYIYGGAELRFFGIMAHAAGGLVGGGDPEALYQQTGPSGGSPDCAFGVTVKNANECARFILNIIRCPEISNVRISGTVPSGRAIAAKWPQILQQWNLPSLGGIPTMNVEGLNFSGGGGGGGGAPGMEGGMGMPGGDMGGGMAGGPGGMPGGPGGGMPGGPGGMPGAPGAPGGEMGMGGRGGMGGGGGVSSVVQPRLDGSIDLLITCQLNRPIMVPSPPGMGGGGAAGGMGGGGMMGPGGDMGGMPGGAGGPPGGAMGEMPGGAAGGPPGGAGGPPGGGEPAGGPPGGGGGGGEDAGGGDE